jgi:transcriptional regulator with XRE-family HTH domain
MKLANGLVVQLADRRVQRRLSQAEVARRLGVTAAFVCRMENGTRRARSDTLERYAAVLGFRFKLVRQ